MKSKHNEEIVYQAVQEGLIEIDTQGRIWRLGWQQRNRWGTTHTVRCPRRRAEHDNRHYLQVFLRTPTGRVPALAHRIVYRHFFGPIPGQLTVNHRNGDKKDNRPANLELATHHDQKIHAIKVLGRYQRMFNQDGEKNHMAKLTADQVRQMRRMRKQGLTYRELSERFGVCRQTAWGIVTGKYWPSVGQ